MVQRLRLASQRLSRFDHGQDLRSAAEPNSFSISPLRPKEYFQPEASAPSPIGQWKRGATSGFDK